MYGQQVAILYSNPPEKKQKIKNQIKLIGEIDFVSFKIQVGFKDDKQYLFLHGPEWFITFEVYFSVAIHIKDFNDSLH